jgi:alpha-N-arabinofuranosidase
VRYATMLRHVDPTAELVVCGHDDSWNIQLLETIGKHQSLIDHLSIHHYWTHGGPEVEFSEAEYYALLHEAAESEAFIERTKAIIKDTTGNQRIGIALDEWGVWHPEARDWGDGNVARRRPVTYEQAGTLRDALAAAVALEGFHRQCSVLTLANLAQIVNVLQAPVMTDGTQIWLTPTYYALQMHTPHIGATALPVDISHGPSLPDGSSAVSATASRTDSRISITLINRHYRAAAGVSIQVGTAPEQIQASLLTAAGPQLGNSADNPVRVAPAPLAVTWDSQGQLQAELPPHSLTTIVLGE